MEQLIAGLGFPIADAINIVKNAIGSMNATCISDREKGDFVLGSYFITLSLKLSKIRK